MPELKGIAVAPKIMEAMQAVDRAEVSVEAGIEGDARGRKRRRQVTVLFEDDWKDAVAETGGTLDWIERRANLLVTGMRSPGEEGGVFAIGDVRLEVTMETEPCDLMESKRAGLKGALAPSWRGGVCCRVVSGGSIGIGDDVTYTGR